MKKLKEQCSERCAAALSEANQHCAKNAALTAKEDGLKGRAGTIEKAQNLEVKDSSPSP
jgi:hypothetical protein